MIFIVSIAFILSQQIKKLESIESIKKYVNIKICVILPSEDNKILEFNQYQKYDKAPYIIYADPECLIGKIDGSKNNPENSFITNEGERIHQFFQYLQYHHLKA